MKVRLSQRAPFAPTFFSLFHLRKVPPSLYQRWKLSGSVLSHHPPRVYDHFCRIFYVCLVERMFACVSAFPKRSRVRSGHSAVVRISRRPTTSSGETLAPSNVCAVFCSEPTALGLPSSTRVIRRCISIFSPPRYRQDAECAQSSETGRQDDFSHSRVDADTAISEARCQTRWPDSRTGRNAYHQPTRVA